MIKDSGERETFETGAQRDTSHGKPRPDLVHPYFLLRLGKHMAEGAEKYDDWNWTKGIPTSRSWESLMRHLQQYAMGMYDEDHLAAAAANLMFIIVTEKLHPELHDMKRWMQLFNHAMELWYDEDDGPLGVDDMDIFGDDDNLLETFSDDNVTFFVDEADDVPEEFYGKPWEIEEPTPEKDDFLEGYPPTMSWPEIDEVPPIEDNEYVPYQDRIEDSDLIRLKMEDGTWVTIADYMESKMAKRKEEENRRQDREIFGNGAW